MNTIITEVSVAATEKLRNIEDVENLKRRLLGGCVLAACLREGSTGHSWMDACSWFTLSLRMRWPCLDYGHLLCCVSSHIRYVVCGSVSATVVCYVVASC